MRRWVAGSILFASSVAGAGTPGAKDARRMERSVRPEAVRAHLEFLAADALRGRGSATHDEWVAATYVAARLRELGVEPAGEHGGYLQSVALERRRLSSPTLAFRAGEPPDVQERRFTHGREIAVARLPEAEIAGSLLRWPAGQEEPSAEVRGRVVLLPDRGRNLRRLTRRLLAAGAVAVLAPAPPDDRRRFEELKATPPRTPIEIKGLPPERSRGAVLMIDGPALAWLSQLADGARMLVRAEMTAPEPGATWNVLAALRGRGPDAGRAVMLSAHLDHLGINPALPGDGIFNGADDDASGVAAVLELARMLAAGDPPRRTALFVFFGSEETGGLGSRYFLERPPLPLADVVADLQFEMLGRPDPGVPAGRLWLTGYERSDLGPALAEHGAPVVADPHPEENFFERSDNYRLARRGVVAHTVSSFGLHPDYHGVDDEVDRVDFEHLARAVEAMAGPIRWLLDSTFVPRFKDGQQP